MFIIYSDIQEFQKGLSRPVRCRNWNLDREVIEHSSIIAIDDSNRSEIRADIREQNLVILHCHINYSEKIGISLIDATSLWDRNLKCYSRLIYSEGIAISPTIQIITGRGNVTFDLYFEPLPLGCKRFDLVQHIANGPSFMADNITRNHIDEYWVEVELCPF